MVWKLYTASRLAVAVIDLTVGLGSGACAPYAWWQWQGNGGVVEDGARSTAAIRQASHRPHTCVRAVVEDG